MISYAQNGEDVVLDRALGRDPAFYVDVGAASPDVASVTRHFYEHGWRGVDVEPVPAQAAALRAARPRDIVVEAAAGAAPGRTVLHLDADDPHQSSVAASRGAELAAGGARVSTLEVAVTTLDDVLAAAAPDSIAFVTIDVEGSEGDVLAGLDLTRWRPRVILVEATAPNSYDPTYVAWEPLVTGRGYRFAFSDGINRFYVADEADDLAARLFPATPLDGYETHEVHLLHDELRRASAHIAKVEDELGRKDAHIAELTAALRAARGPSAR